MLANTVYPDAQKQCTLFLSNHGNALSNHVVKQFFEQQSNYRLFTTAICFPTKENWERLDQSFRRFYIEIRFINYITKVLWRYARDFRSKSQRDESRYLTILDQPIQNKGESPTVTYKDQVTNDNESDVNLKGALLDKIGDSHLQEAIKQLTDRQLKVLDSYYVDNATQKEIAHYLGVSQQSVSKTVETALTKIKRLYEEKKNS